MNSIRHIQFASNLAKAPADRPRKKGVVYPKVAQDRMVPDRGHFHDLRWDLRTLSAAAYESTLEDEARSSVRVGIQTVAQDDIMGDDRRLSINELSIAVRKVVHDNPANARRPQLKLDNRCLHAQPEYDEHLSMPSLSISNPSSTSGSSQCSENVTPTDEFPIRQLEVSEESR
ncbi:hypothetical protein K474DRAFT_1703120 [Panus rudis PR-1116 ss-1]|nr:hypothetical protein K474DRAFT_1703120 [Panus rudis PR-1116 ss-1]